MRYEQFKTVALIAMIGLSLFFTYQLWTYQPNMEALEGGSNEDEEPMLGEDREVWELIQPEQLVLHHGLESYSIVEDGTDRYNGMIEAFPQIDLVQAVENETVEEREGVEVIFPDAIPTQHLLNQYEGDLGSVTLQEIDRMFFYVSPEVEEVNVQLSSNQAERIETIRTAMPLETFEGFLNDEEQESELEALIVKEEPNLEMLLQDRLYVTSEPQTVDEKQFRLEKLEINQINQRFFSTTEVPRQNQLNGAYVYTDGSRIVTVDGTLTFLNFSYPFAADSSEVNSRHIIDAGTSFINGTGGWTDDYALSSWNTRETSDTVDFRMQMDGLPVFDRGSETQDRMKISVSRSGSQITNLQRPLFKLEGDPLEYSKQVPSGKSAVEAIKQVYPNDWESVTNVKLGYRANTPNTSNIHFVPTWYYEMNNQWKRVPFEEENPS